MKDLNQLENKEGTMENRTLKHNALLKYILLCLSMLFIAFGMIRGEHLVVLKKAVNICLECIGVG